MAEAKDSRRVPLWLWRTTVGSLVVVVLTGSLAALWLNARPTVIGAPIPAQDLGAWTLGPGASGGESNASLTLNAGEPNRPVYASRDLVLADFSVQVRAALRSGPDDSGYGLMVRRQGPDSFVALFIGPDGYIAIGQMSGGIWRWRVPWQQWPHIKRGKTENVLRAQCRADRCRFFVNDEFAFEVDDLPAGGQIGPAVWNPAQGETVSAVFREWQVWK